MKKAWMIFLVTAVLLISSVFIFKESFKGLNLESSFNSREHSFVRIEDIKTTGGFLNFTVGLSNHKGDWRDDWENYWFSPFITAIAIDNNPLSYYDKDFQNTIVNNYALTGSGWVAYAEKGYASRNIALETQRFTCNQPHTLTFAAVFFSAHTDNTRHIHQNCDLKINDEGQVVYWKYPEDTPYTKKCFSGSGFSLSEGSEYYILKTFQEFTIPCEGYYINEESCEHTNNQELISFKDLKTCNEKLKKKHLDEKTTTYIIFSTIIASLTMLIIFRKKIFRGG